MKPSWHPARLQAAEPGHSLSRASSLPGCHRCPPGAPCLTAAGAPQKPLPECGRSNQRWVLHWSAMQPATGSTGCQTMQGPHVPPREIASHHGRPSQHGFTLFPRDNPFELLKCLRLEIAALLILFTAAKTQKCHEWFHLIPLTNTSVFDITVYPNNI